MNRNFYSKILTVTFCAYITGMMSINFVSADETFSPTENRTLAQQPTISVETLMDGSYMTDYETYLYDQFFARDQWVALKSTLERLIGKQENNDVFFCSDDTLINKIETPSPETMEKNAGYMNALAEKTGIPVYVGLIPSAAEIWSDRLPANAPTADEAAVIADFSSYLHDDVGTIPFLETLSAQREQDLFYRTDHHWTSLGAYYGYESITKALGMDAVPLSSYTQTLVAADFFGTIYSSSGVRWVKPDSIHRYVEDSEEIKVVSNFTGMEEEGALYVDSYLEEKDKYSYFLGGIQPLCVVETGKTDLPTVLIIRDSYADSMVPFMTENFSKIYLMDLRFYNASVATYVENNDIDHVIVMYSVFNFASDNNLFKLGL